MLQVILTMVWFGYRASRAHKSLAWSLFGLLYALVFKIVIVFFAVNAKFNSTDGVVTFQIFSLVIYVVVAVVLGFMLLPTAPAASSVAIPVTDSERTQEYEEPTQKGKP